MAVVLESPYIDTPGSVWLRGNLHAHSTRSDGVCPPQDVVDRYAAMGYEIGRAHV